MCVCVKHGCPRRQQSKNMAKIAKSYILTTHHPKEHVISVKCEDPIYELTVQVWLLYHHPNFKYCTLIVRGTDIQSDDPITRCPRRTFQAGGIKTTRFQYISIVYLFHVKSVCFVHHVNSICEETSTKMNKKTSTKIY